MAFIVFRFQGPDGKPISGARVQAKSPNGDFEVVAGTTCGEHPPKGYLFTDLGAGHYDLTISAPFFQTREMPADLGDPGFITVGLEATSSGGAGFQGPLAVDREMFTAGGQAFTVIEATDFQLFQEYANGQDILGVLGQRASLGYNMVRVLSMCDLMFQLNPRNVPDYYTKLKGFLDLCKSYGLYVELVVFADATRVMPGTTEQAIHWAAVGQVAQQCENVILELVNEADQTVNKLAILNSAGAIPGVICSHGSNGSEQLPVRPAWGYETRHYNDAFEWWRKTGHNSMEISEGDPEGNIEPSHKPVVANENTRFPDKDSNLAHAFDAAASAALLCAGSCFHSVSGKSSMLWIDHELECARAWADGARSVNLAVQHGAYVRRDDLLTPELLRVYERAGEIVRVRK